MSLNQQSRRDFIKTALSCGVATALSGVSLQASAATHNAPKFIFINFSDGYPRGTWHPSMGDNGLEMNLCTQGLAQYKDNIVFLSGCESEGGSGHGGYNGVWQERSGQGSLDVHFENAFAAGMPKRAVRLGVDTNYWGHGGLVTSRSVSGAGLTHEDNPQSIFNELFGGQESTGPSIEARKLALLSNAIPDIELLRSQVNGVETQKTSTFSSVTTEVEQELTNASNGSGQCSTGIFGSTSSGRDKRADLQVANAVLALSCEKTKVVSLQLGTSNDSKVVEKVSQTVPHDASHYGSQGLKEIYINHRQWYLSKVTRLIDMLKLQPDDNGNMFDNTIIMVTSEMDDGQAHSSRDLPVLLIGGKNTALNTKPNGHLIENVGPIGQVLKAYANAYGVNTPYQNPPLAQLFNA
ncbi:DUF1552 domain-containing protein [Shewanella sp. 10N.286.45.A1]|uniref:DUF1552 domain-containing protein n=1 Tax=Shewanella sp. 10N.286.45.A1 TaxID=3229694 RepID=UPI0035530A30